MGPKRSGKARLNEPGENILPEMATWRDSPNHPIPNSVPNSMNLPNAQTWFRFRCKILLFSLPKIVQSYAATELLGALKLFQNKSKYNQKKRLVVVNH